MLITAVCFSGLVNHWIASHNFRIVLRYSALDSSKSCIGANTLRAALYREDDSWITLGRAMALTLGYIISIVQVVDKCSSAQPEPLTTIDAPSLQNRENMNVLSSRTTLMTIEAESVTISILRIHSKEPLKYWTGLK